MRKKNTVISLGGGAFLNKNIQTEILSNHLSFWLKLDAEILIKRISFPSPLKSTEDIYDDNLDVFIELKNRFAYRIIVGTPKSFLTLMNWHEMDFLEPGCPLLLLEKP